MKYQFIEYADLVKLNKIAKKKNLNQYLGENVLRDLYGKTLLVKFAFVHNGTEMRYVLHGGRGYDVLLFDVDFKDMHLVRTGYLNKEAA